MKAAGSIFFYLAVVSTAVPEALAQDSGRRARLTGPVPAELRALVARADHEPRDYRVNCIRHRGLQLRILDPILAAALALEQEDAGFFWSTWCVGAAWFLPRDYEPVVTIQITPRRYRGHAVYQEILGEWVFLRGRSDASELTNLTRMELLRDGGVVAPLSVFRAGDDAPDDTFRRTYYGSYKYPREAFTPGAEVVLRVWRDDRDRPQSIRLREQALTNLSRNFELYFEAMSSRPHDPQRP